MSSPSGARRVLVADDDPGIRELLVLNLRAEGFVVDDVDNGIDACARAVELRPDLVVLDVMMPGRDGLGVLEALRADEATADIPVVLLTAKCTDDEVWAGWQAGADYYITKPFDVDELIQFVNQLS
jgi:DNA-binding response OmpR family regulator